MRAVRASATAAAVILAASGCRAPWYPTDRAPSLAVEAEPERNAEVRVEVPSFGVEGLGDHEESVRHVVFAPRGDRLASSGISKPVLVWSLADKRLLLSLPHVDRTWGIAFSADGAGLYAAGDRGLWRWDLASGRPTTLVEQPGLEARCLALSPRGDAVAAGTSYGDVLV